MRASEAVARLPRHVVQAFQASLPAGLQVAILQNPTSDLREELADAKDRGRGWRDVAMFAQNFRQRRFAAPAGAAPAPARQRGPSSGSARLEENYFYSSRRFPNLTNNTIGGGALVAGTYPYFNKGVNDDGAGAGFPTGFSLTAAETNLETGGTIPQGTSFVFNQLGITFDSDCTTADLAIMLDVATLAFSKAGGQFNLFHGPLKFWPGGMGIDGIAAAATTVAATTTTIQAAHNGSSDIRAVRTLKIPRILREKETFAYSVIVNRATKAKDGSTIALSNFIIPTIWLFGGQRNVIPT